MATNSLNGSRLATLEWLLIEFPGNTSFEADLEILLAPALEDEE